LRDSLSQFVVSNALLVDRLVFLSSLGVVQMQQWVGLIDEMMNVKSWIVLICNHCYQSDD